MLSFRKFLVAKNFMDMKGEYQNFLSKISCLTVPKNFVGQPFRVSLIRVSKKLMLRRVMSRFFVDILLSHSTEKFRRGTLLCWFQKIFGSEKVYG